MCYVRHLNIDLWVRFRKLIFSKFTGNIQFFYPMELEKKSCMIP